MKPDPLRILNDTFHFSDFREGQEDIIETILSGQDVVAVMPTGSGKSLCYQLPALLLEGMTLVISPLIALMKDQVDGLARNQIPATFINSTLGASEQHQRLQQVRGGQYKLVYIAPERFRNIAFMEGIQSCPISLLAVDEAHCVSEWGHDFRPDYLRLKDAIAKLNHPPVAALTATATPEVRRDIVEQLGLRTPATFVTGFDRPNLRFEVKPVEGDEEKFREIRSVLSSGADRGIIYAATRKNVEKITAALQAYGYKAGPYHAGMEMDARKITQERFMQGTVPVVVATNAFGMGIDKADLRFIIHHDVPGSIEAYYQEVGRAGRDGQPASCLLLFNYADTYTQEFFIEGSCPPRQLIEDVYRTLCNIGTDEIEITIKALGERLNVGKINDMAISSALKLLEKADYIERGTEGEHLGKLTLRTDPATLRSLVAQKPLQKEVAEYCLDDLLALKDRTVALDVDDMASDLGLSHDQIRRSLSALHNAGQIEYRPPFRGRGMKILRRVPVSKLDVNYAAVEKRAQFERQKLRKMVDYAYSRKCLRRVILEYFGEEISHLRCHNCSACLGLGESRQPKVLTEEQILVVKKALSCVARMKGRYGKMRVVQVLTGSKLKTLTELGLTRLSTYGLLQDLIQPEVVSVLDALLDARLLEIEGTDYPLIKLTESGRAAMVGESPVHMVFPLSLEEESELTAETPREGVFENENREMPFHQELFEALRDLRRKLADQANLPPYIIFHDSTLKAVSRQLPRTLAELQSVKGLGNRKITVHGNQLLAVVGSFLESHSEARPLQVLENPQSVNLKSRASPAPTDEATWKLWQEGKSLNEIAETRGLTRSTIVTHLEQLMLSGRPIELKRLLSDARIAMIATAIAQAQSDRLSPVKALLPDDVTYEEIRLVRGQLAQKSVGRASD